jgi:anion-transporting  ArsA/GET3 family ATPase
MSAASFEQLVATREVVICCGSGGVGKTTTAAATGVMVASELGGRVLVLTVDPARRLATSLGLRALGNDATRVDPARLAAGGLASAGELWVAMLDTKQSWDDLVTRHAPDEETRERILANPLYQDIAGRFVQSHDYIAMERLYELHSSGQWDLIVVDTPPSRHAIDFLDAPARMVEFFGSRLLRWLVTPASSRLLTLASRPFYTIADRILGSQFLEDIAEFFLLFQSMYDGFVERAQAVSRILADRRTTFVVVSTLEAAPAREAEFFVAELERRHLDLGAIVLNKALPGYLTDPAAATVASRMRAEAAALAAELGFAGEDPAAVARVLDEVGASFLNFQQVARREADQRRALASRADVTVAVPQLAKDVADLDGLVEMGRHLWRQP